MKVDTFYIIVTDTGKVLSSNYSANEYEVAKRRMVELARENPNERISLMRRVHSVTSGLVWEDSI